MFIPPARFEDIPTVAQMVTSMDRTVAGLRQVKQRLAVVLRRFMVAAYHDFEWVDPSVLLIGPTGSGKTFMLKRLLASVPVVWTEAALTEFSDVGWTGRDLASMYLGLTDRRWREIRDGKPVPADVHRQRAQRWGVVILDEFDKLRSPRAQEPSDRHVGKHLQYELLKMVEGTVTRVKASDNDDGFPFHTDHVLHIAVGAFAGEPGRADLAHVIMQRLNEREPHDDLLEATDVEDVIDYGFIPELVGRFATVIPMPALQMDAMVRILNEQIVPVWQARAQAEGLHLEIVPGAAHSIASLAKRHDIGARSLEPILEKLTWMAWAEAQPGDTIVLTAETVGREHAELRRAREDAA